MGLETNEESIMALDRQIEEGNGDIIKLKRARNSLLNISARVPPEILGDIFSRILFRPNPAPGVDWHFNGFYKDSYNFLLVCNHWFQVASHTPELWTYCGNTLQDWKKWFRRHPQSASVDLVLNDRSPATTQPFIDHIVQDALRDHATRDIIRQVHLMCHDGNLLSFIVPSITPEGEGVQCRSIESIDIRHPWGGPSFDVSPFFTRIRLPKLRSLLLHGSLKLPPWNHIVQQTTVLTTLSLRIEKSSQSSFPTASQFFSMLISNPGLQVLSLEGPVIPEDDDSSFAPQVILRHLERLYLRGELHHVTRVLERLVFPHPLNSIQVVTLNSAAENVLQNLGPYVRRYFRGDRGFWDQLKLGAHVFPSVLAVSVKGEYRADDSNPFSASFKVLPAQGTPQDVLENLCHDFVTFIPQEHVCAFDTNLPSNKVTDLSIAMPNIKRLGLIL